MVHVLSPETWILDLSENDIVKGAFAAEPRRALMRRSGVLSRWGKIRSHNSSPHSGQSLSVGGAGSICHSAKRTGLRSEGILQGLDGRPKPAVLIRGYFRELHAEFLSPAPADRPSVDTNRRVQSRQMKMQAKLHTRKHRHTAVHTTSA